MSTDQPIFIATRGSALALAQAHKVLNQCRAAFPDGRFEIKIIKTTGDKLQTASLANEAHSLPKGLFTKELEVALLNGEADLAVHSLKDLPTALPTGLCLGAIGEREDPRDVLIFRAGGNHKTVREANDAKRAIEQLPPAATVGTGSTRRKAQLLMHRSDLKIVEHRGNVLTRIEKLAAHDHLDAIVLAAAGMNRLNFLIGADGILSGAGVPIGLLAVPLPPEIMLPAVGQGAIGLEIRENDASILKLCEKLNHRATQLCATAERAFLAAMGGGCQSPVAAYAELNGETLSLRAISFQSGPAKRAEGSSPASGAAELGRALAAKLADG